MQAQQQFWADPIDAPNTEFAGGTANDLGRAQADLLFEGLVDLYQTAVAEAGNQQNVRTLLEHGGKLLLRESQGILGILGFADIDHQPAHDRLMPVFDQADDIAYPKATAIGTNHPILKAMVAPRSGFAVAVGLGPEGVIGVDDAAPEARTQPLVQWITE
ncbi:hypothetical protein D3C84_872560 [compost metagenome]